MAKIAKKQIVGKIVKWMWEDGTQSEFSLDDLTPELIEQAALHGLAQKLGDSYAGKKTIREAKNAWQEVANTLRDGHWNRKGGVSGIWIEALAKAAGVDIAKAHAKWAEMDDEARAAVRKHPDVRKAKLELELERAGDVEPIQL